MWVSSVQALEFKVMAGITANDAGCKSITVKLAADRPAANPTEEIYRVFCASKKPLYLIVTCDFRTVQCLIVGCDAKTAQCPGMNRPKNHPHPASRQPTSHYQRFALLGSCFADKDSWRSRPGSHCSAPHPALKYRWLRRLPQTVYNDPH